MTKNNAKPSMGLLVLVVMTLMWTNSYAQPSCQAPIVALQSCVGLITGSSVGPVEDCCTQLTTMIQTQSHCLCTFINAMPQIPLPFNRTQAITLPGVCNIQAPPLSQCDSPAGINVPAGSGQDAVAPAAPGGLSPPSATSVPAAKGASKTGPTTTKGQSSSSSSQRRSTILSTPSFFFLFSMALAFSTL